MNFAEIVRYVPIKDMIALYQPEMDIHQFVDKVNAMYKAAKSETTLKLLRQKADLSQRKLAAFVYSSSIATSLSFIKDSCTAPLDNCSFLSLYLIK